MSNAVATISHIRGETISWGLRSTPAYDGTETVTCVIKPALNGAQVPGSATEASAVATVSFVTASGDDAAYWHFELSPTQSSAMNPDNYITDAKVVFADGVVDYPLPLCIQISERVTA